MTLSFRTALVTSALLVAGAITMSAQRGQGRPGGPPPFGPAPPGGGRGGAVRPMDVPASNPMTVEKIALGRSLFFDTSLSADRTISCATCHRPDRAFADSRGISKGVHGGEGTRNAPSLVDAGYERAFFWDGRAATLETQVLGPITDPREMGLAEDEIPLRTGRSAGDVAAALATYVRTIRSGESRFDWFQAGQTDILTTDERAGFDVFRRSGCGRCHGGPNFTDGDFHNTGVGFAQGRFADAGRFAVTNDDRDRGAFKTPTLRNVALTAPYMHDGSLTTLDDVVKFYSNGGVRNPSQDPRMRPLNLSDQDQRALVAFLKSLTGRVVEGLPQ